MQKAFKILITAILGVSLLSGCGAQQSKSSGSAAAPAASAAPAAPKVKMSLASLSGASNDPVTNLVNEKSDQFNASNKFNVEFQLEKYEGEQYKTKITTLMASNAQPDVFYTYEAGFLKPFVAGAKVYPIGDALDKDSEWKGRFVDGVFGPLTFNNKVYGVPMTKQACVMYYNKKLFNDAGIKSIPKTYNEFLSAVDTFKKMNIIPISVPMQKAWIAGQFVQQLSNGIGGDDLYNKICNGSTKWDDPRFIEAGTVFTDLIKRDAFQKGFLGMTQDEGRDLFKNEKAAMLYAISTDFAALTDPSAPVSKNVDFFLLPPIKPENNGVNVGSIGNTYAVSAKAKNIEAAVAFVKTLSDKDIQEKLAYTAKQVVATKQKLDEAKLNSLTVKLINMQSDIRTLTPWFDRIFGAGEGVEFNNTSVAIAAGKDPAEQMKKLQKFAEDNSTR